MTLQYTANLRFPIPDFLSEPWHADWESTVRAIDDALYHAILAQDVSLWTNSHVYLTGNLVISPEDGTMWSVQTAHTSAASPTTFSADRIAHPTYWNAMANIPQQRGTWLTATSYLKGDFVVDTNRYAVCIIPHVSGVFNTDLAAGKWVVLIDVSGANVGINTTAESSLASAATTDIGAQTASRLSITGTATITSFGVVANQWKMLRYTGAAIVTHNATTLVLLGGADRTMRAGDIQFMSSNASGQWRELFFSRGNGYSDSHYFKRAEGSATQVTVDKVLQGLAVSLIMYGAACDGATNDTNAFQNALISGNKYISLPNAATTVVTTLNWADDVTIFLNGGTIKRLNGNTGVLINGANRIRLQGPGSIDGNFAGCPSANVTLLFNNKSDFVINQVDIKNSVLHGLYCQDCTSYEVDTVRFLNGQYELAAFISYHLAADAVNVRVKNIYVDATSVRQNGVYFVPQSLHTISHSLFDNIVTVANAGDVSANEHSSLLLLQSTALPDIYFISCRITACSAVNMNFPFSLTGMKGCTVNNMNATGGGTIGYGFEFANCIDCSFDNLYGDGNFSTSGCPIVLNNCFGCTLAASVGISRYANVAATGIVCLNGNSNTLNSCTVRIAGGTGINITGDDYTVGNCVVIGVGAGCTGINLNTGNRRHLDNNKIVNCATPIINLGATDTAFDPNIGLVTGGSLNGYTGAEIKLIGGASAVYGITTDGTGAPTLNFDHRATSNAGSWRMRNGTAAGSLRHDFGGDGAYKAYGSLGYPAGAGVGGTVTQATNKATAVTLNKINGTIVMNNASLAAGVIVGFTLNNTTINTNDDVSVCIKSGGTNGYLAMVNAVADGSCVVSLYNATAGALGEAVVLKFSVRKGSAD